MPYAWPQRIQHELETSDRPLIVTNRYPTYADLPYRFVPHGGAFLVQDQASMAVPADTVRTDADLSAEGKQIRTSNWFSDTIQMVLADNCTNAQGEDDTCLSVTAQN